MNKAATQPSKRLLKQVTRLNNIAGSSLNAYKFPAKYTKLELTLIGSTYLPPSVGLKRFWREHLPTLKFHNYDTDIVLTRIVATVEEAPKVPASIKCYTNAGIAHDIDCLGKLSLEILQTLIATTEAEPVKPEDIPQIPVPV